jgi:hypothetical protein
VQLEESNQVIWQHAWEQSERHSEVQPQQLNGNNFFHPLDGAGEPTLQIGYGPHIFSVNLSSYPKYCVILFRCLASRLGKMHEHPNSFYHIEMIFKLNGVFF